MMGDIRTVRSVLNPRYNSSRSAQSPVTRSKTSKRDYLESVTRFSMLEIWRKLDKGRE